ncbi:MAG: GreA/GreB family elongation factor, partial [Trueperaceae bacterium]
LPPGARNLVTPQGLAALRDELAHMDRDEADLLDGDPQRPDRARRLAVLRERRTALEDRLASAEPVLPPDPPDGRIRVGSAVTVERDGEPVRFRITGVDEADPLEGTIAHTAPLAQAVLDLAEGDDAEARIDGRPVRLRIVRVGTDAA